MTAREFQLADLFEIVADAIPGQPALITEDREMTYRELDERATRLANHLRSCGIRRGDHVGVHAMNCPEWVEAFFACCKLGAAPINVNYRYVEAELRYLYDNADCVSVIVAPEYVPAVDAVRDALPDLRTTLVIGPEYEAALAAASPERDFEGRSADDRYVLYTGGTTGMPKGVVWRHEDVFFAAMNAGRGNRACERPEQLGEEAAAAPGQARLMALGPLMHGGSQWLMGNALFMGGVLVLSCARHFDPHEVLRLAERSRTNSIGTIGDAMARPIAEALLDPACPAYDLSNVITIGNGGAPLSVAVREQIGAAMPNVMIIDSFGASESGAQGSRVDGHEGYASPRFVAGPDSEVLDEAGVPCPVGVVGRLARTGRIPLGYYGDEEKTRATFPVYGGTRWVVPGDFARREEDGSISLLGRGSVSINSGGEKVYPEEVEAALKHHPAVFDAVVVGTPNPRWGEQVTAIVQLRPDADAPTTESLMAHARTLVADFKVPKAILVVDAVQRTPVGKADYRWAKETATALLAAAPT